LVTAGDLAQEESSNIEDSFEQGQPDDALSSIVVEAPSPEDESLNDDKGGSSFRGEHSEVTQSSAASVEVPKVGFGEKSAEEDRSVDAERDGEGAREDDYQARGGSGVSEYGDGGDLSMLKQPGEGQPFVSVSAGYIEAFEDDGSSGVDKGPLLEKGMHAPMSAPENVVVAASPTTNTGIHSKEVSALSLTEVTDLKHPQATRDASLMTR